MVDLKKLQKKINELFESETTESLLEWFNQYDEKAYLVKRFGAGEIDNISIGKMVTTLVSRRDLRLDAFNKPLSDYTPVEDTYCLAA
ncbi:MAG: hypothetical protein ABI378_00685 [Chitinophagaceae bacterium]